MPCAEETLRRRVARRLEKAAWTEFVAMILRRLGWTGRRLAKHLGVSSGCVSMWQNPDWRSGRVPSRIARKALVDLAFQKNLVEVDGLSWLHGLAASRASRATSDANRHLESPTV